MQRERLQIAIIFIIIAMVASACGAQQNASLTAATPTVVAGTDEVTEVVVAQATPEVTDDPAPPASKEEDARVQLEGTDEATEQSFLGVVRVETTTPTPTATATTPEPEGTFIAAVPVDESDAAQRASRQSANVEQPTPIPTSDLPVRVAFGSLGEPVENIVTLRFDENTTPEQRAAVIASVGGTVEREIDQINTVVVSVPDDASDVQSAEFVANTEPDYYVQALADINVPPADPFYNQQWGLAAISAPARWSALPNDAAEIVVAVIDSGICSDHPDVDERLLPGYDFVEDDATPQDELGHGCGVAGVIAGEIDNGEGISGIAPNARVMPLRVLDADGLGRYSNVAAAITYAVDNGAHIVNLSLGGLYPSNTLLDAVNYAQANGVVVIAAAGNAGTDQPLYPAAYDYVYSVGSLDSDLEQSSFSNYGDTVDLWAPGRSIITTRGSSGYVSISGTSFAAPHAAGIAAMQLAMGQPLFAEPIVGVYEAPVPTPTITPSPTATLVDETPRLFLSTEGEQPPSAQTTTDAVRSRNVEINTAALPTLQQALTQSVGNQELILNFFEDDAEYLVSMNFTLARPGGTPGYVWVGTVDGSSGSEVVLVVDENNHITGHVIVGSKLYEVHHADTPIHTVSEIAYQRWFANALTDHLPAPIEGEPVMPDVNAADAANQIDVLVAYTTDARNGAGGTNAILSRIDANVVSANLSFVTSGVNFQYNLVDKYEVNYAETGSLTTALNDAVDEDNPALQALRDRRDATGADLVVLVVENNTQEPGRNGFAFTMTVPTVQFEQFAYSVIRRGVMTFPYTFAHETGHNMGGSHDFANDGGFGSYDYSNGYQDPGGAFVTIMSFPFNGFCSGGQTCQQIMRWSSSSGTFEGAPVGNAEFNDMVRTLNENAYVVANFRASQEVETIEVQTVVNPPGAGTLTVQFQGEDATDTTFPMGAQLTVLANANSGFEFNYWDYTGELNNDSFPVAFPIVTNTTPGAPMVITANFIEAGTKVTNDNVDGAKLIDSFPYQDQINTDPASIVGNENPNENNDYERYFSCHFQVGHTVWYQFVGDGNPVAVDTIGSNYNTTVSVYQGRPSSLNAGDIEVGCDFSDSKGGTTKLIVDTVPNATYYIGVAGTRYGSGDLVLNVNNANLLSNGDFTQNLEAWIPFGSVSADVQGETANITRVNSADIAGLSQQLGSYQLQPTEKFQVSLQLGNNDSVSKHVTLRVAGRDSFDLERDFVCFFTVPANTSLQTYSLSAQFTTSFQEDDFSNIDVQLFVDDYNEPSLLVDNFQFLQNNNLQVTDTVCDVPLLPDVNLMVNNNFSNGDVQYFFTEGLNRSIDGNGVLNVTRSDIAGTHGFAQGLRYAPPAGTPLEATVQLGNTADEAKFVFFRLWEFPNESSSIVCFFVVPPNTGLQTYTLQGVTNANWANLDMQMLLGDYNEQSLLVDDFQVQSKPNSGITQTNCDAPLPADSNLIVNDDFQYPFDYFFVAPGLGIDWANGILNMTRAQLFTEDSQPNFTPIAQNAPFSAAAGTQLEASVQLGNSSSKPKLVSLHLWSFPNNDTRQVCLFTVPANTPLSTYTMQMVTAAEWSNIDVQLYVDDFGEQWLQVDELNVQYKPNAGITALSCDAPLQANTNLVLNGDIGYGNIFFNYFGEIVASDGGGFLNLTTNTPSVETAGLLGQPLFRGAPSGTPFEATVQLGNPTNETKFVAMRLWDFPNNANEIPCFFQVLPNTPLQTYTLRGVTNAQWTNMDFQFFLTDTQPNLQFDNLNVQNRPNAGIIGTECLPPGVSAAEDTVVESAVAEPTLSVEVESASIEVETVELRGETPEVTAPETDATEEAAVIEATPEPTVPAATEEVTAPAEEPAAATPEPTEPTTEAVAPVVEETVAEPETETVAPQAVTEATPEVTQPE